MNQYLYKGTNILRIIKLKKGENMKYKKAKEIVEKSFSDDNMTVEFGRKFRFYPRLRRQMKQWARETLEGESMKVEEVIDVMEGELLERVEEAIKGLEAKGLIVSDEEGVRITDEGIEAAKWLIENDQFSKDLYKKLGEEEDEA